MAALVSGSGAMLKTVDAFIDSLRGGETGERSPLFNAARYPGYAACTEGMLVLDFDLRLEGTTIVKDALFTGISRACREWRFSGTGCMSRMGPLRLANAVRRLSQPGEVDLRGDGVSGDFFGGR